MESAEYTDVEVAIALNVTPRPVQRYCQSGRPRGRKVCCAWRILASSVREFQLADQRVSNPVITARGA